MKKKNAKRKKRNDTYTEQNKTHSKKEENIPLASSLYRIRIRNETKNLNKNLAGFRGITEEEEDLSRITQKKQQHRMRAGSRSE